MGEYADMQINGDCDFYTGEYIGKGTGIPRTQDKSLPWERPPRKSEDLSWRKVISCLRSIGVKPHQHPQILKEYGCTYSGKKPMRNACFEVLKDFEKFKVFAMEWRNKKPTP